MVVMCGRLRIAYTETNARVGLEVPLLYPYYHGCFNGVSSALPEFWER